MTINYKTILIMLLSIISTILTYGQQNQLKKKYLFDDINTQLTYNYGKGSEFNAGLSLTNRVEASIFDDAGHYGPYIDIGYIKRQIDIYSTRIGYDYSNFLMIFCGRLSLYNYTDFHKNQFYVRPEIGLTALGIINLTYGYNFNLSKRNYFDLTGSYVALNVTLKIKRLNK